MEDFGSYVDNDDASYCSLTDSDKVDSDVEAELYSKIHYDSLSYTNSGDFNEKPSELSVYSPFSNIFSANRGKNISTPIKHTDEVLFLNELTLDGFSSRKRKSPEIVANCEESEGKLSYVKKHKPDSSRDLQIVDLGSKNVNDLPQFEINNSDDEEVIVCSNSKNQSNKKIETVPLDSSDSDNEFWIKPSSVDKTDLQINLLKDTDPVFLNSPSSDDESSATSPFVKKNSVLKNLSMPNLKLDESSEGLWHINLEDLHRLKRHSRRYHENFDATCSNCNRKGHTYRSCPSPRVIKCFLCGGNHFGSRCSSRMCSNCCLYGHDSRNCWQNMKRMFCDLCKIEGHTKGNCPDLWRRYHLTTKPSNQLVRAKQVRQDKDIYCWNCGQCGHFGSVCPLFYPSRYKFNIWPCVISYNNPRKILKNERLPFLRRYPHLSLASQDSHSNNTLSTTSKEQDILLKTRNKLNVSNCSNEENRKVKGKKKKSGRTNMRFSKIQNIVKGKDFPRTPKAKNGVKHTKVFDNSANEPASPELLINKEFKKIRKEWKKYRKTAGLKFSHLKDDQDFEMNFEDNLPEFAKVKVKKLFKKWKNNIWNRRKKKRKRNETQGRELTNS